jgi:hypothetical protein
VLLANYLDDGAVLAVGERAPHIYHLREQVVLAIRAYLESVGRSQRPVPVHDVSRRGRRPADVGLPGRRSTTPKYQWRTIDVLHS